MAWIKSSERVYRLLILAVGASLNGPASSSPLAGDGGTEHKGGHGRRWGGLRTWPTVHPTPTRLFLHGLGNKGTPICSPTRRKTVHGLLETTAQFGWLVATVKTPSGGVSASGTTSTAAMVTNGPPLSSSSTWEPLIWWFDGAAYAAMASRIGSKFARGARCL
jgi:hypothetical protein